MKGGNTGKSKSTGTQANHLYFSSYAAIGATFAIKPTVRLAQKAVKTIRGCERTRELRAARGGQGPTIACHHVYRPFSR